MRSLRTGHHMRHTKVKNPLSFTSTPLVRDALCIPLRPLDKQVASSPPGLWKVFSLDTLQPTNTTEFSFQRRREHSSPMMFTFSPNRETEGVAKPTTTRLTELRPSIPPSQDFQ